MNQGPREWRGSRVTGGGSDVERDGRQTSRPDGRNGERKPSCDRARDGSMGCDGGDEGLAMVLAIRNSRAVSYCLDENGKGMRYNLLIASITEKPHFWHLFSPRNCKQPISIYKMNSSYPVDRSTFQEVIS